MTAIVGITVVDRMSLYRLASARGTLRGITPTVNLDAADAFRKFRGLDGDLWPHVEECPVELREGLAPLECLPAAIRWMRGSESRDDLDLIVVSTSSLEADVSSTDLKFLGCDVASSEPYLSGYSSILNEVIWGLHPRMRAFGKLLNDNLLFATAGDAARLVEVRSVLLAQGVDLEDDCEIDVLHVYEPAMRQ